MFTGFNIKYPEYEVVTPHTNQSFTLRCLNVQEEENLRGSVLTPNKVAEHLNKVIFDVTVTKPEGIIDYNTFLKNLTLKDREALLFGLYHITYEEVRNYDIRCTACRHEYQVTVKATDMLGGEMYPNDDILTARINITLPISNVVAVIKQPTLFEEAELSKRSTTTAPGGVESLAETLVVDRFEYTPDVAKEPIIINNRDDVVTAYKSLPARDKKFIFEGYTENFGKYGIKLQMKTICTSCGNEDTVDVNLMDSFFRMVLSS